MEGLSKLSSKNASVYFGEAARYLLNQRCSTINRKSKILATAKSDKNNRSNLQSRGNELDQESTSDKTFRSGFLFVDKGNETDQDSVYSIRDPDGIRSRARTTENNMRNNVSGKSTSLRSAVKFPKTQTEMISINSEKRNLTERLHRPEKSFQEEKRNLTERTPNRSEKVFHEEKKDVLEDIFKKTKTADEMAGGMSVLKHSDSLESDKSGMNQGDNDDISYFNDEGSVVGGSIVYGKEEYDEMVVSRRFGGSKDDVSIFTADDDDDLK
jgi:hypothetical protein